MATNHPAACSPPPPLLSWRYDPLTERTVRIAPGREKRPNDFSNSGAAKRCPFCAGNEADTPGELDRIVEESGNWLARVVPNAYPIVAGADGAHEVVIESPRHDRQFCQLPLACIVASASLWARRLIALREQFGYVLMFKNEGQAAGASMEHVHSQVIAFREPPPVVAKMWARLAGPIDLVQQAAKTPAGWRVGWPEAQRMAGETWIVPETDGPALEQIAEDRAIAENFAELLQDVIMTACELAQTDSYNLVLQLAPIGWWLEVLPRSAAIAGIELATGIWVNPASPESCAAALGRGEAAG